MYFWNLHEGVLYDITTNPPRKLERASDDAETPEEYWEAVGQEHYRRYFWLRSIYEQWVSKPNRLSCRPSPAERRLHREYLREYVSGK